MNISTENLNTWWISLGVSEQEILKIKHTKAFNNTTINYKRIIYQLEKPTIKIIKKKNKMSSHHLFTKPEIRAKLIEMWGIPVTDDDHVKLQKEVKKLHKTKIPTYLIDDELHKIIHRDDNELKVYTKHNLGQAVQETTAKVALEKGFNWVHRLCDLNKNNEIILCEQELLDRWFRKVHNINIIVSYVVDSFEVEAWRIGGEGELIFDSDHKFKDYENALEIGLIKSLNKVTI